MDSDLFSNVTYRIKTESARQLFSLNPVTGELAVLQTLDFEDLAAMGMGASYTFQVEAVDQGGIMPPGQATVTVRITVRAPGQSSATTSQWSFLFPSILIVPLELQHRQ